MEESENDVVIDLNAEPTPENEVEGEEELPEFDYDDDDPNLAAVFAAHPDGRDAAKAIVAMAKKDHEQDWEGSAGARKQFVDSMRLFRGDLQPKTFPYKSSANANVPLMVENLSRLQMRMMGELFGDWSAVFGVIPVGEGDENTSDILTKHGNWQLRQKMPDFRRQMARGCLLFLTSGDVTGRSYYDPLKKRNCHEALTCDRFVVPYGTTSVEPDYSDLPHYSMILNYHRHEVSKMRGIWHDVDAVLKNKPSGFDSEPDAPLLDSVAESKKVDKPTEARHTPYKIIQYEGWFSPDELPNQEVDRFLRVIFDYHTSTLLSLTILEEDDWEEGLRYKQQLMELAAYRNAKDAFDAQVGQAEERFQNNQGLATSETAGQWDSAVANAEMAEDAAQPALEAPPPPEWMEDPTDPDEQPRPPRKKPIYLFSHGVCIEPLEGPLGIGYGQMLADMNRAANTALSQYSDAATASNVWSVITPADWSPVGGNIEISPGKWNKIPNVSGKELREGLIELRPNPPSEGLIQILRFMVEWGQSATQAPDILSGESGKSGETYRGLDARIDQATKQLTVVTRSFSDWVQQIIKNNAYLNSIFLPEQELVSITDPIAKMSSQIPVRRDMYARSYQIEFRSDMRFTSQKQRIDEAGQVLAMFQNFQFLMGDVAFAYKAMVDLLKAYNKQEFIAALGPAPSPPPTTFGMMPNPINGVTSALAPGVAEAMMMQQQTTQSPPEKKEGQA